MAVWRRLAMTAAAMVLALGGAVAVETSAQAVPPDCSHGYGHPLLMTHRR